MPTTGATSGQIIEVLRHSLFPAQAAADNVSRFVDALAFNWIVGGTDAHAKNRSVLLRDPDVRLAPPYDVASALPCGHMHAPKLQLAMKVGGRYNIDAISGRQWRRFAEVNALDPDDTVARIDQLAERAPETFTTVARSESVNELRSQLPARLVEHRGQSRKLPNETPAVAQDRPARTRGPPTRWARGVKWSRRKPLRPAMGVFPWDSHWEHATWLVVSGDNPTTTVYAAAVAGRANRP
jgi:hypothetical protein